MIRNAFRSVLLLTALSALVAACGQDQPRGDPLHGGAAGPAAPVRSDGLPDGHPNVMGQLPQGHPPMTGPGAMAPASREADIEWTAPAGWKESPASGMRLAQFDLPGAWSDGAAVQCIVYTQMGGGTEGNLERWKGMVGGGTEAKITTSTPGGLKVSVIEARGSYTDSMARPPHTAEDGLFLGAVVDAGGGDSVYTIKLAGPREVVEAEKANFDALVASLRKK